MNLTSVNDQELIKLLTKGAVGVLPTDTVYGIVAVAANKEAVIRLYATKNREQKPGTVIAANLDQLVQLGIKRRYLLAVEQFWPGPVTVVLPTGDPELNYLDQGVVSLAVRVVDHPELVELLEKVGPLLTSSANQPGEPPANTIEDAKAYFGSSIDFYVDGGDLGGRQPSTIIKILDDTIEVIRHGAVKIRA